MDTAASVHRSDGRWPRAISAVRLRLLVGARTAQRAWRRGRSRSRRAGGMDSRARPVYWATLQVNLGSVLISLGERESGTARLEEAVTAVRAALEEWTRERAPFYWATLQVNLGNALAALGGRTEGPERLGHWQTAIASWRNAQLIFTREQQSQRWAGLQNSIGYSLVLIGERENDLARFEEAVPILREALAVQLQLQVSRSVAATSDSLCRALLGMGSRKKDRAALLEARQLCQSAMDGIKAAGDNAAETADNLARIADALETLP
jgi:tetratricopeptide (TPR) repeat protein